MFDQDFYNDCILGVDSKPYKPLQEWIIKDAQGKLIYQGRKNYICRRIAAKLEGTTNGAMKGIWPGILSKHKYSVVKQDIKH